MDKPEKRFGRKSTSVVTLSTSSENSVPMVRPISLVIILPRCLGISRTKMYREGAETSTRFFKQVGCFSATNAQSGRWMNSSSPTRIVAASAPGGSFFRNRLFGCKIRGLNA